MLSLDSPFATTSVYPIPPPYRPSLPPYRPSLPPYRPSLPPYRHPSLPYPPNRPVVQPVLDRPSLRPDRPLPQPTGQPGQRNGSPYNQIREEGRGVSSSAANDANRCVEICVDADSASAVGVPVRRHSERLGHAQRSASGSRVDELLLLFLSFSRPLLLRVSFPFIVALYANLYDISFPCYSLPSPSPPLIVLHSHLCPLPSPHRPSLPSLSPPLPSSSFTPISVPSPPLIVLHSHLLPFPSIFLLCFICSIILSRFTFTNHFSFFLIF